MLWHDISPDEKPHVIAIWACKSFFIRVEKLIFKRLKGLLPPPIKRAVRHTLQDVYESIMYFISRENVFYGDLHHVVFVCKGNICRSAFAEYYLGLLVPKGTLKIESCGLDVDQGGFSPSEAIRVGREFGVELGMHRSKGLTASDLQNADLIVPMEYGQYLRLLAMFPDYKRKIKLLRDFISWPARLKCNIYDPFGLGEGEYRRCFMGMQIALDGLKKYIMTVDSK